MIAADLAGRLGQRAEMVCRHYLDAGYRQGNYWLVGDVRNTPGRSMYVRLRETPKGSAGKWTDAATGEHGDLLDVIRESSGLVDLRGAMKEARRFLSLPTTEAVSVPYMERTSVSIASPEASRRLFAMAQPIHGTPVEAYLRSRGVKTFRGTGNLRFHPRCYCRPEDDGPTATLPAMIAAVTDLHGAITGAHRTWLSADGMAKAPIDTPRRAMGNLLGHAVRFGRSGPVMAAGEGIETMLSMRCVLPDMPMVAALSAVHLGALLLPPTLSRLYIIRDNDPAGEGASARLVNRALQAGIEAIVLSSVTADFNDDLRQLGLVALRICIADQLNQHDRVRYLNLAA